VDQGEGAAEVLTDDDAPNGRLVELTPKTVSEWDLHEIVSEDRTSSPEDVT
jgi:hypothetical protein